MLYFPPLRRLLLPSLVCLAIILCYRFSIGSRIPVANLSKYIIKQPDLTPLGERVPLAKIESRALVPQTPLDNYLSPPTRSYYSYPEPDDTRGKVISGSRWIQPAESPFFAKLFQCPHPPNKRIGHIRLPNPYYNISMVVTGETENEKRDFLNPAIISLPHWSKNQYLLVSRVQTDGSHMVNLLCEANICFTGTPENARPGEQMCTPADLELLGPNGGLRCATTPMTLNVPPTPAEHCGDGTGILMDIPGFHDPRIFWTGRGEPLMMVNSQSRYSCFGLWIIDLRKLYPPLQTLLASNPGAPSLGPLMSYPSLTELTRNPPHTRGPIEKNWMFFFAKQGSYLHYDIGVHKRTFAKVLGGGLTTVNLTDPFEQSCLVNDPDEEGQGSWHQATNSLRLILCDRHEDCQPNLENEVFFALVHHKHKGMLDLPIRYERHFIVWSAIPPFSMVGASRYPILMANETATGYTAEENWDGDEENLQLLSEGKPGKGMNGRFSYTVSLGWASGRALDQPSDKNFGYLDDEVILGIGVDDMAQVYSRVKARDLLQCLRACPGRASNPLSSGDSPEPEAGSEDHHDIHSEAVSNGLKAPANIQEVQSSLAAEINATVEEASPSSTATSSSSAAVTIEDVPLSQVFRSATVLHPSNISSTTDVAAVSQESSSKQMSYTENSFLPSASITAHESHSP